jgi:UDP-N-acetylmuramoyl-tripeptide--D-alanyl-D-alanine ligase
MADAARFTPGSLAAGAGGRLARASARPISGAFVDSRAPVRDGVFVPIVAARDGHDFITAAVQGGASAVLVGAGRPLPDGDVTVVEVDDTLVALQRLGASRRERTSGPVVAISGSNGKTTTRAMIAAVLQQRFDQLLCTQGNLNNHLGVPLTLLGPPADPEAMVIELGMSAPGENDLLARLVAPTVAVITSIALEHLEFMGSIEAIAAAEAEPIAHVRDDGIVVVPSDEPLLSPHLPRDGRLRVWTVGPDEDADVRILGVQQGATTRVQLATEVHGEVGVELALFGAHNARNAGAALAVGTALDVPLEAMLEALSEVRPVGDRGRVLELGQHLVIADCYNANPGSVDAALRSLAPLGDGRRRIAVLGDMLELGPTEHELHAEVGRTCAALRLDAVVAVGDRAAAIARAAAAGGVESHATLDVQEAATWAAARLGDAGAVLVKGSRGMRLERVVDALAQLLATA